MPQDNNTYNDTTAEILGKMPSWTIRWGMMVIFVIFVGLIIGSYLIRYPQIVTAPIIITTLNPPADLLAKASGRIDTIFVSDGDMMAPDGVVAMLQNSAIYDDVIKVNNLSGGFSIDGDNSWLEENYSMGELQGVFSDFKQQFLNYQYYIESDNVNKKIALLGKQIDKYKIYVAQIRSQGKLQNEDYAYTIKSFERDSILHMQKAITAAEFEKSKQYRIQKEVSIETFKASLTNMELSLLQMNQQLLELQMQRENDLVNYHNQINESCKRLLAQIEQWKQTYLLVSPVHGKLSFSKFWSNNQNIQIGDKLATIIPLDSSQMVGIMEVPTAGFGKVKQGQVVNVKLNGYPYFEYGLLKGKVGRISSVPDKSGYIVEVSFPNGLQSTYKEQLRLIQQMDGVGDIITVDQRLILRFINPLRAFFDKVSE